VHGRRNFPKKYSESAKLDTWFANQRSQYSLHLKGETSQVTLPPTEALERLGFEWEPSIQPKSRNAVSHALIMIAGSSPENEFIDATKKPSNSVQGE
jgi:hypothetical protein